MRRFSKKWIALTGVAVVVAAALVAAVLHWRREPQFTFLGEHVPVVVGHGNTLSGHTIWYAYTIDADFDAFARTAIQELTALGFTQKGAIDQLANEFSKDKVTVRFHRIPGEAKQR